MYPAARRLVISLCLGQPWLHRDLRCWRAGGDGRFQGGVDRDQAIESAEAEHAPDDRRGDHQPQLRAADGGALVGTGHSICASVIARNCRGHVRDQRGGAAVDDQQQLFADPASIGHVDVLRKRHHRLRAHPLHRVSVVRHGSDLLLRKESRAPDSLCQRRAYLMIGASLRHLEPHPAITSRAAQVQATRSPAPLLRPSAGHIRTPDPLNPTLSPQRRQAGAAAAQ